MNLLALSSLAATLANSAAPPDAHPALTILILFVLVAVVVAVATALLVWLRRR
jgi:uncharacterized membrane protein (DUF106 family)